MDKKENREIHSKEAKGGKGIHLKAIKTKIY